MMDKRAQQVEELLEKSLDSVTSHPAFLSAVSTMLNVNSYRKIWFRKSMEALWKELELPIRRDQEVLLAKIDELQVRIKKLEMELEQERLREVPQSAPAGKSRRVKVNSKAADLEFQ